MVGEQIERDVRALVELLAEQREVVMMRYFAGLSFKDIAEQTDVSINTALGTDALCAYQPAADDQGKI